MMRIVIAALLWVGAGMAAEPVFFWDMETEQAAIFTPGSDSTVRYYANAACTDSQAYAGSRSLHTQASWAAAMFDNNTNDVVWAPVTEGTIEFFWQYHAPWGDQMLFQMTGKSSVPSMDTNDGIGLRTRGGDPGEFFSGTARNLYHPITLVENQWYRFRVRYKSDRGVSLQIDDGPQYHSADSTYGPVTCVAWHQILIGNDRNSPTVSQNIDNFAVYDYWLDDDEPSYDPGSDTAASFAPAQNVRPRQMALEVSVSPNPMRSNTAFVTGNAIDITGLVIYDVTGRTVHVAGDYSAGVQHGEPLHYIFWNGCDVSGRPAPAGTYFYRVETADGVRTGSFMKISE